MKDYFINSLHYYMLHLSKDDKCNDPFQVIIKDISEHFKEFASKEQIDYLNNSIPKNNEKMIDDLILIIKAMKLNKKYDEQTISLLEQGLKSLKNSK